MVPATMWRVPLLPGPNLSVCLPFVTCEYSVSCINSDVDGATQRYWPNIAGRVARGLTMKGGADPNELASSE